MMLQTLFSFALGPYDSTEAVRTLPAQLQFLRTFRDLGRSDLALIYRLSTEAEPDDLAARFMILCVGRDANALTPEETTSLRDQLSIATLPAWSLTFGKEPPLPKAAWRGRLEPLTTEVSLPIKPDWAHVVDLMRRRDSGMTIDLTCVIGEGSSEDRLSLPGASSIPAVAADFEQEAANFFRTVALQSESGGSNLNMYMTVHAEQPIDEVLAQNIGRSIWGLPVSVSPVRRNVAFPSKVAACVSGPPEELIRAMHPPYGPIEGRGLSGHRSLRAPIRFQPPKNTEGTRLGYAIRQGARSDARVPIALDPVDRLKHVYVLGKTGAGKTTLLKNMVRGDIESGAGVGVIDPHGDLVDYALRHVEDRADEVVLLDFSDPDAVPVLNPLLLDVETKRDRDLAIEELLDIIVRRTFNEFTGPVFEDSVRLFLSSVLEEPISDKIDIPSIAAGVEIFRHQAARRWIAEELKTKNSLLAQEWTTFNGMLGHNVAENVRWILAKFSEFNPEGALYSVTGGPTTPLSIEDVFVNRGILLVKLPEAVLGTRAASFLGALVFARLHRAALSRLTQDVDPFYLHVDEFQRFVSADIEGLVAEARKFNLALTLAHQNLRQLDAFSRYEGSSSSRLREALFSNVGTIVCMKTSGADVRPLADEFGVHEQEIRRIGQYDALLRAVVDGAEREPFSLSVPDAAKLPGSAAAPRRIRRQMLERGLWWNRKKLQSSVDKCIATLRREWTQKTPRPDSARSRRAPKKRSPRTPDNWLEYSRARIADNGGESKGDTPTDPVPVGDAGEKRNDAAD